MRRSSREVVDGKFTTNYWDVHYFVKAPDIVFMTPPSQEELALAQTQGVELTIKPVCYDSFVFITHKDNPVDNLSTEQVQKIYSGEITNWNQVGGHDEEITAFQREKGSGSQTAMEELVMAGLEMMDAPEGLRIGGMGFMIDRFTAEYQNAPGSIGYTYKYYIDTLYKSQDIKVLSIDGIAPDNENVRNISYPFVVPYNGVIRSADANGIGGKFLDFVLSEEGQKCVAQAGYVSVLSVQ
ncbi:MAG: substrate-binding domain-containing protein [Firmicutes bacterium]|nr:substrate-binding domain-containing protein [Bacillota bacterium]